jgi:hypothetical protein
MKTPHTSASTIVTNQAQRELINSLERKHLEEGGSLLAQVYQDGLRIRVLTPKQTDELADALSKVLGEPRNTTPHSAAFYKQGAVT